MTINPALALSIAVAILSQAAILIRFAQAPPLAILFWRLAIAFVILLPFQRLSFREVNTLRPRDWGRWVLAGFSFFLHFYSFFVSVQQSSIAASNILFCLNTVTTAAGAWLFFSHRLSARVAISIALGASGVAMLFASSSALAGSQNTLGLWSGVGSALTFSIYILVGKSLRTKLSNLTYTLGLWLMAIGFALVAMLMTATPFFSYSPQSWLAFGLLAILPTLIGHATFTWCLNHIDINVLSAATLVEPVLASVVAILILNEHLDMRTVIAFLLTSASVLWLSWPGLQRRLRRKYGH